MHPERVVCALRRNNRDIPFVPSQLENAPPKWGAFRGSSVVGRITLFALLARLFCCCTGSPPRRPLPHPAPGGRAAHPLRPRPPASPFTRPPPHHPTPTRRDMINKFYEDGIKDATKAIALDNERAWAVVDWRGGIPSLPPSPTHLHAHPHNPPPPGKFPEALDFYLHAIERLSAGIKFDKEPTRRAMIADRAMGYADRAEQIKAMLKPGSGNIAAAGGSGGALAAKPPGADAGGGSGEDAENAKLKGSLQSSIVSEKPNVKWDDVAGLEAAKDALKEAVILPVKFPQLFVGNRKPWKGILLYGPPGTGKSYLAKAVATEAQAVFFSISSSDIMSKWQGEAEKQVRNLFQSAREQKPAIIFIDEIDALCRQRGCVNRGEGARVLPIACTRLTPLPPPTQRRRHRRRSVPPGADGAAHPV